MIKLKNVSKFYYSKGIIASGFSKVNLELNIGEFVAITGESGSGKSTLLNVISGLDTYEEGEMYINGEETSHYTEQDFEDYRRKYIGNIFQNFNLVNSYTVYQNIELVLILNGGKKKNIKKHIIELIKKVDLYKFRNTKVSKLSGGQKQRVAIARALAKDTPIIIADEPTGNLDSKSAQGIIKLLSEIANDKLVVVVTHNYEQVEKYVTRKIKMHDGKILEDKKIKEINKEKHTKIVNYKNITLYNQIRLGIRNAFNILPKFILVLLVYLFISTSLLSEYSSLKKQEYLRSKEGVNNFFNELSDRRIVINKTDKTPITKEDYNKIESLNNIDYIAYNDLLLDTQINITDDDNFWFNGNVYSLSDISSVDKGVLPQNDNEVVIVGNSDDYYIGYNADSILGKELYMQDFLTGTVDKNIVFKVVGIKYDDSNRTKIYVSEALSEILTYQVNKQYSKFKTLFRDTYSEDVRVITSNKVNDGEVKISIDLSSLCKNNNCNSETLKLLLHNLYYDEQINLKVTGMYDKKNIKTMLDVEEFETYNGSIFVSQNDYDRLFKKDSYQSSVFVKDVNKIDKTIEELKNLGFKTLKIKDTLVQTGVVEAIKIITTIVSLVLIIVLFFVSYFVLRIILKSRNIYFSTLRMLGATKKISKNLLIIELFTVANLSYLIVLFFVYICNVKEINIEFVQTTLEYLKPLDYIILYIILIIMSYFISVKFSKKLFKDSAIKTIKEDF